MSQDPNGVRGEFLQGATGLRHVLGSPARRDPKEMLPAAGDRVGHQMPAAEIEICPFLPTLLVVSGVPAGGRTPPIPGSQLVDRTEVWEAHGETGPPRDLFSD